MAEFKVGGKVIALVNHHQGAFKNGDIFILRAIRKNFCHCGYTVIDIGKIDNRISLCPVCGFMEKSNTWWFYRNYFAPLDDIELSETTYEEVMQQMEVAELVANG